MTDDLDTLRTLYHDHGQKWMSSNLNMLIREEDNHPMVIQQEEVTCPICHNLGRLQKYRPRRGYYRWFWKVGHGKTMCYLGKDIARYELPNPVTGEMENMVRVL